MEMGRLDVDWIILFQVKDEFWSCENGNEPSRPLKLGNFLADLVTYLSCKNLHREVNYGLWSVSASDELGTCLAISQGSPNFVGIGGADDL